MVEKLNEYQQLALRTSGAKDPEHMVLNSALGLNGEAGEVADLVKKHIFQGHDLDRDKMAKELGDVLWYVASGAAGIGYTLAEIAEMNVEKLRRRYPDGFDVEKKLKSSGADILMTLKELKKIIDHYHGHGYGDHVVVITTNDSSIGGRACVAVKDVYPGIDWESHQVRISTDRPIWQKRKEQS